MGWKRAVRRIFEKTFDVYIVRRGGVSPILEWDHLHRLFNHFEVDCVFDVGANSGQYADRLRTEVGYSGVIVSFEPIPELAQQLRAKAAADRSWFIEELALDAQEGHATFNILANNEFSSLHQVSVTGANLFREHLQVSRQVPVRTSTVAVQLQKYKERFAFKRPFLKMDTQGHDLKVASGAGEQLREFIGLQSELAIHRVYERSPTFQEALEFYRANGFELSALVPNSTGHFPLLVEIDSVMIRSDLSAPVGYGSLSGPR
jgi:FkbM family methyltransferase